MDMLELIEKEENEYAKKFYINVLKHGYELVGESRYIKTSIPVLLRCPQGHERLMNIFTFNKGHLCKECALVRRRENDVLVKAEYFEKFYAVLKENDYDLVDESEYKNSQTEVLVMHNKCGHKFKTFPAQFFAFRNSRSNAPRCSKCSGVLKKTDEHFASEVYDAVGNEYSVVSKYSGANKKISMRHNEEECGFFTFECRATSFIKGISRCPKCRGFTSKGEKRILHYLSENKIEYAVQYRDKECRKTYTLPFDFAIYKSGRLLHLIEYQGIQHYQVVEHFHGEKGFRKTREHDLIKKKFCKEKGIDLIEIPYWEIDNIEKVLEGKLNTALLTEVT